MIGPAHQVRLLIIESNEEVPGVHQFPHNPVQPLIELVHIAYRARSVGDLIKCGLDLLGATVLLLPLS